MTALADIGGMLHVRPGARRPQALASTRRPWAAMLAGGRDAEALPGLLASLFSLCGHAHRLCATLALSAAAGRPAADAPGDARQLQVDTIRDHVRQVCLAWPGGLSAMPGHDDTQGPSRAALLACPALRQDGASFDVAGNGAWLQDLLGLPAADWLASWERDPKRCLHDWCDRTSGWLPRLVAGCEAVTSVPSAAPVQALDVQAGAPDLAARLRESPGFGVRPTWRGECAETGTWTRLNAPRDGLPATAWLRLGARIAELVRLVLPDAAGRSGAGWLAMGSTTISDREGLAWVEMARGLLVHYVRIDVRHGKATVDACGVLAPTDWNFHPDGAVARAIEAIDPAEPAAIVHARLAALMTAYDPCVRYAIEAPRGSTGTTDA